MGQQYTVAFCTWLVGRPQPPRLSLPTAAAALYTTHPPRSIDAATSTSAFSTVSSQTRSRTHSIHQLPSYSRSAAAHFPSSRDVSHTLTLHHIARLSLRATHFFFPFATASATLIDAKPHTTTAYDSNHSIPFLHVHTPQLSLRPSNPSFTTTVTHSYGYTLFSLLHLHLNHALPVVLPTLSLFPSVFTRTFESPH
mmetsp:Transcript_77959/g.154930  ORF Transcript_77959/g.154930 Transcript_77959/m.154930 type:complete len:196 (-) Transcript_77959:14-601(-)